jgi:hypothetical protein
MCQATEAPLGPVAGPVLLAGIRVVPAIVESAKIRDRLRSGRTRLDHKRQSGFRHHEEPK